MFQSPQSSVPSRSTLIGRISAFFPDRHWGFLTCLTTGARLFYHASDVLTGTPLPAIGDRVNFKVGKNSKGTKAIHVSVIPTSTTNRTPEVTHASPEAHRA